MILKRYAIFFIALIFSCNLISCGLSKDKMINLRLNELNEDAKISNKHLDDILGVLKSKDKEALKEMFSVSALKVAKDIDKGIDYVMDFFDGEIISVDGGPGRSAESNNSGVSVAEDTYQYTITTDKGIYEVFLIYISKDTFNPENEGLYMLQIIDGNNVKSECDKGQVIRCPGVYCPPVTQYTDIKFQDGTEVAGGFKFLKYEEDHSDGKFNIYATIQSEIAYGWLNIAYCFFDSNGKKIGLASGGIEKFKAGDSVKIKLTATSYGSEDLKYEDIASCRFYGIDAY